MNPTTHNSIGPCSAEDTLRLIASLPAPEGLEERVQAALHRTPRSGRILTWPAPYRPANAWMRTAAAAAIVFVVAGGGWGVYSHVGQGQLAKTMVLPRVPISGGFSSAGAMRTPQTLDGPVVARPAPERSSQALAPRKGKMREAPAAARSAQSAAAIKNKKAIRPIAAPAR